jgi:hypothetical protein
MVFYSLRTSNLSWIVVKTARNILVFLLLTIQFCNAQSDSSWLEKPRLNLSGYAEVYYVYDFNQPQEVNRQSFLFNHNRHNEVNLNLGFVKIGLEHAKYRANLALQSGTYSNDNYAAEPGLLQGLFEANIGVSLNKMNNLWVDVGILPSHIGFESAIAFDNWTMTRSLLAENSPYFLSGAKLSYSPNKSWMIAGLIMNGWQRIQRIIGNSLLSIGSQITYIPNEFLKVNWSTFIGTNDPDVTRRMRYFNNFFGQFQINERFSFITGFDIGAQQKFVKSNEYDVWLSPVMIGRLNINKYWETAIRAEYYHDKAGSIIPTESVNGFQTTGISLTADYSPAQNILFRIEARRLSSQDKIFESNLGLTSHNFIFGTSLSIAMK